MVTPPYITSEQTTIASASTIFQLESTCDFKQNYVWTHSERFQCEKYSQKILRRDYAEGKCYSVGTGSLESFPQAGRKHSTNGARVYSVLAINSPQEQLLLPNTDIYNARKVGLIIMIWEEMMLLQNRSSKSKMLSQKPLRNTAIGIILITYLNVLITISLYSSFQDNWQFFSNEDNPQEFGKKKTNNFLPFTKATYANTIFKSHRQQTSIILVILRKKFKKKIFISRHLYNEISHQCLKLLAQ